MEVVARVNPAWMAKWVIMGILLLGLGAWCFYDATVTYPEHNRRVAAFEELEARGQLDEWPKIASENGWTDEDPGEPRTDFDILSQWIMLAICVPLGLASLITVAFHAGRTLSADETGVRGRGGERVPYERITAIDKSRWDRKGIAVLHFESDGGDPDTLKLDDWVFRGAAAVLAEVEKRTGLGENIAG
jgi:hypothetical protein